MSGIFIKIQKTIKFSIKNAKCNRTRECLKIFRSQIPSINHFYTFPEIKPTENYLTLIKSLPSEKSLSLAKEYLIKTDIIDKSEVQNQIFLSEERVKGRLQLPTEAQYEDFEEEKFDGSNMKHEKELLDQYHQKTEKDDYEGIEDYMEVDKIDKNYEKYKFLLEINGNEEEKFNVIYSQKNGGDFHDNNPNYHFIPETPLAIHGDDKDSMIEQLRRELREKAKLLEEKNNQITKLQDSLKKINSIECPKEINNEDELNQDFGFKFNLGLGDR